MITVWREFNVVEINDVNSIFMEQLWDKHLLRTGKMTAPIKNCWVRKGIWCIKDLFRNGSLMSHTEISETYQVPCTFLDILAIRHSIPARWKNILLTQGQHGPDKERLLPYIDHEGKLGDIAKALHKDIYRSILGKRKCKTPLITKWKSIFENNQQIETDKYWQKVYVIPYQCTIETKYQGFQYRMI